MGREGTKRRPNQACIFVEYPKTGTARSTGPAPYRAAWSLSSVERKAHTVSGGKPSVAGALRALPTQASDVCLQRPSLPAARLNKRTAARDHLRLLVSGRKFDTEETGKHKTNKQKEPLQK